MSAACRILCLARTPEGAIRRIVGTDGEGQRWEAAPAELAGAIERGEMTCYVTLDGHSHLVSVRSDGSGAKRLVTFLGDVEALGLPDCA